MSHIFLSYDNDDRERARQLVNLLEAAGWSVWWDRRIPTGKTWRAVLEKALVDMECMLVLWSSRSVESHWVIEEAEEGLSRGKLLPLLIEDVRPPRGFREIQALSFVNWDGTADASCFRLLLQDVAGVITKPEGADVSAAMPDADGERRVDEASRRGSRSPEQPRGDPRRAGLGQAAASPAAEAPSRVGQDRFVTAHGREPTPTGGDSTTGTVLRVGFIGGAAGVSGARGSEPNGTNDVPLAQRSRSRMGLAIAATLVALAVAVAIIRTVREPQTSVATAPPAEASAVPAPAATLFPAEPIGVLPTERSPGTRGSSVDDGTSDMKRKARAAATADGGKGSDRQDEQRIGARIDENTRALLQLNEEVRTAMAQTTPPTDAEFALFVKKVNARQEEFERLSRQLEEVRTRNMPREGQSEEQRNIEFERIKADMVRLNQMQQALSNTLNSLDEKSKNAIQRIKGG